MCCRAGTYYIYHKETILNFPRVTEILRPFTSYDKVPPLILEKAASRGTSVHAICASIAKGAWIPDSMIDEELLGYVTSFSRWSEAQVKSFVLIEKRFQSNPLQFTGQLDFVIEGHDGLMYLADLKTSSKPQKTYPIQMAAYDYLLRDNQIKVSGAMIVYLDKTGEFPEIHLLSDMTDELHIFMAALDCYKYFNKGKING